MMLASVVLKLTWYPFGSTTAAESVTVPVAMLPPTMVSGLIVKFDSSIT